MLSFSVNSPLNVTAAPLVSVAGTYQSPQEAETGATSSFDLLNFVDENPVAFVGKEYKITVD